MAFSFIKRVRDSAAKREDKTHNAALSLPTPDSFRQTLLLPDLVERFNLPLDDDLNLSHREFKIPSEAYVSSTTLVHAVYCPDIETDHESDSCVDNTNLQVMDISDPGMSMSRLESEASSSPSFSWTSSDSNYSPPCASLGDSPTKVLREQIHKDKTEFLSKAVLDLRNRVRDGQQPRDSSLSDSSLRYRHSDTTLIASSALPSRDIGDNDAASSSRLERVSFSSTCSRSSINNSYQLSTRNSSYTGQIPSDADDDPNYLDSSGPDEVSLEALVRAHLRDGSDVSTRTRRASYSGQFS